MDSQEEKPPLKIILRRPVDTRGGLHFGAVVEIWDEPLADGCVWVELPEPYFDTFLWWTYKVQGYIKLTPDQFLFCDEDSSETPASAEAVQPELSGPNPIKSALDRALSYGVQQSVPDGEDPADANTGALLPGVPLRSSKRRQRQTSKE